MTGVTKVRVTTLFSSWRLRFKPLFAFLTSVIENIESNLGVPTGFSRPKPGTALRVSNELLAFPRLKDGGILFKAACHITKLIVFLRTMKWRTEEKYA